MVFCAVFETVDEIRWLNGELLDEGPGAPVRQIATILLLSRPEYKYALLFREQLMYFAPLSGCVVALPARLTIEVSNFR